MTDIATLGYSVDSSGLARATTELDRNTAAAGRTQKATEKLDREFKKANATQLMSEGVSRSVANGMASVTGASGGAAVAVREVTMAVLGLSAPLLALVGVVAGLGIAWKRERDQLFEFDKALIKTSGYAGKTAEELSMLAGAFGRLEGATRKGASEALLKVAESGRFTEQQFMQVSRAATLMEGSVGQSIDTTISKFEKLADDPVKALLKLNEAEHFLTRAQLDRVNAMVEEGREQDAVAEAVRIYSERLTEVANQANAEMPTLSKWWREIKDEISGATWQLGQYLNLVAEYASQKAPKSGPVGDFFNWKMEKSLLQRLMEAGAEKVRSGKPVEAQWAGIYAPGADVVDSKAVEAEMEARKEFDRLALSNLSKAEKLEKEIADIRKKGAAARKSEADIEKAIADARARYKESLPKGSAAAAKVDPADGIIERLQKQVALNEEQAIAEEKLTSSQRLRLAVEVELAALGDKVAPKRRAEIADLLERVRVSDEAAVAAEKARKAEEALMRLREQTGLAEQNQSRANEIGLLGIGRGTDAAEMLRRQLDLHRWYEDQVVDLRRQAAREKRDVTLGEEQELKDSLQRQLDAERQYQEQRRAAMADWSNGATKAFEDYLYRANDVAGQTAEIFSNAFYGLENTITDFLHKGSADWKGFLDDMNRQILQFIVRQQLSKWMGSLMGNGATMNANGGGWADALWGLLGGGSGDWGWSEGGYTGPGRKNQPAGVVHRGEVVWSQSDIARAGGVAAVEALRRGDRNRPELLNLGRGGQYLIPGDADRVEPAGNAPAMSAGPFNQKIYVQGKPTSDTARQMAIRSAQRQRLSTARFGG